jgi:CheY-like chemotaxis protein
MNPPNAKKLLILIVDDNKELTSLYRTFFSRAGFEVTVANDGTDCLNILKKMKPDIMLLDVEMPDMDGNEVMEFMQQDEELKKIPVVVLTGTVAPENSGMKIHDVVYLSKLSDIEDVINYVKLEAGRKRA